MLRTGFWESRRSTGLQPARHVRRAAPSGASRNRRRRFGQSGAATADRQTGRLPSSSKRVPAVSEAGERQHQGDSLRIPTLVALVVALSPLGESAQRLDVPACTRAMATCERWIAHAGGKGRSMAYATHSLDEPNAAVSRALIMVHGGERDANRYYETAVAAAFLAGVLNTTVVVAPRYPADDDARAVDEVLWSAGGQDTWRGGGRSPMNPSLTSFDVMDDIVTRLATKKNFPNLTTIVVAGHSAGGQFVNRYAMANKVHDAHVVRLSYVVASPRATRGRSRSALLLRAMPTPRRRNGQRWVRTAIKCARTTRLVHSIPPRRRTSTAGRPAWRIEWAIRGPASDPARTRATLPEPPGMRTARGGACDYSMAPRSLSSVTVLLSRGPPNSNAYPKAVHATISPGRS